MLLCAACRVSFGVAWSLALFVLWCPLCLICCLLPVVVLVFLLCGFLLFGVW